MCEKFCDIWANIAAQIASEGPGFGPIDLCVNQNIPRNIYILLKPQTVTVCCVDAERLVHKLEFFEKRKTEGIRTDD